MNNQVPQGYFCNERGWCPFLQKDEGRKRHCNFFDIDMVMCACDAVRRCPDCNAAYPNGGIVVVAAR